ncbi:hypothetical protein NSND_50260 [Nitrospira sp. ND1]|nr:hypothetical protein NSND_50260 [Nitrospira sp. ND1]
MPQAGRCSKHSFTAGAWQRTLQFVAEPS